MEGDCLQVLFGNFPPPQPNLIVSAVPTDAHLFAMLVYTPPIFCIIAQHAVIRECAALTALCCPAL